MSVGTNVDNQKIESVENGIADDCTNANNEQIIEKTESEVETVISNEENGAESDWQKPISLKGFKKKLNEIFVVK